MKKSFWVTLLLFIASAIVIIMKADEITQISGGFSLFYFTFFLFIGLFTQLPFIGIPMLIIGFLIVFLIIKYVDNDLIKTTFLLFFMFFTAIQLIATYGLFMTKTLEEEVLSHNGGEQQFIQMIDQLIQTNNPSSKLALTKSSYSAQSLYTGQEPVPIAKLEYTIQGVDAFNTAYEGKVSIQVSCWDIELDYMCDYENIDFQDLQSNGEQFIPTLFTEDAYNEYRQTHALTDWFLSPNIGSY